MPLKISFFNKGVFFNNIKRFWLITFSYTFFLFLFILGYLNSVTERISDSFNINPTLRDIGAEIFSQSNDLMPVFLGFYCLIAALAAFSYMHFPRNTAMVNSLPLRRETLFMTNYLSGLIMVTFPLIFNSIILVVAETVLDFPTLSYAFLWLGVNLALTLLLYSFAVFAGMFTGHLAAQTFYYLIFNFLAIFLEFMINMVLNDLLFGYTSTPYRFRALSPLYYLPRLFNGFRNNEGDTAAVIGYLVAGIIFLVSSLLLYRKRHMEVATDVISFKVVRPIFKYSVSFCSSALLGNIMISILDLRYSLTGYIITYLIGGVIGYFTSEMLLRKTFRVFNAYKGFLAYGIILTLLFCSISFDLYGYEDYVPQDNEVEIMFLSNYMDSRARLALQPESYDPSEHDYLLNYYDKNGFHNNPPQVLDDEQIRALRMIPGIIESREGITKARIIHKYIVENEELLKENRNSMYGDKRPGSSNDEYRHHRLYFGYRLKDGSFVERSYSLVTYGDNTELDQLLRDYLSVPEVREKYDPILGKTPADIRSVTVNCFTKDGQSIVREIDDIQGLLNAYKKDVLASDPLALMYGTYNTGINVTLIFELFDNNQQYLYYPGSDCSRQLQWGFENTISYLIKNNILDAEQIEDIINSLELNEKFKYMP